MKFAHLVDVNDFVNWCDYLGTLAFAISGIRLAAGKGLDWFGAYVVGFVTAVGGGTIRDILLDIKPFWLVQPSYLIITALGLIFTIIFRRQVVRLNHSLFVFDAIGLGLFVVVGVAKSYGSGLPLVGCSHHGYSHRLFRWASARRTDQRNAPDLPYRLLCFGLRPWLDHLCPHGALLKPTH